MDSALEYMCQVRVASYGHVPSYRVPKLPLLKAPRPVMLICC
jgi:hypothetical protein